MMTVEQANLAVVRRLYAAFEAQDVPAIRACFAPDAVLLHPGHGPFAGEYHGVDAILGFLGGLVPASGGTLRTPLEDLTAGETYVVAVQPVLGDRNGKHLDITSCQRFKVEDGQITEMLGLYSDQYQMDDFWR